MVCPETNRADDTSWSVVMQWSVTGETTEVHATGPGTWFDVDTLVVEQTGSDGRTYEHHYVCDEQSLWFVAILPVLDPVECPCETDCAALGSAWEPPLLKRWAEGIAADVSWSETTDEAVVYRTWFDCEDEVQLTDRTAIEVHSDPIGSDRLDLPYGAVDAIGVERHIELSWKGIEWASPDIGWLVRQENTVTGRTWDLVSAR